MAFPVYMICWRNFSITYDCIESFLKTASEPIELTVVSPNDTLPNSQTEQIRKYLREQVANGRIKRALFYEENTIGWGLIKSVADFEPQGPLFMMTDGDLIIPDGVDWIGLAKEYHSRGWVVTGFNLSTENYRPPNVGFSSADDNFGLWGVTFNKEWFYKYHGVGLNSIDSRIMQLARGTGGAVKIREIEALHATWSIQYEGDRYEDKEYAKFKREKASNWVYNGRPQNMNYELVSNG